MIADKLFYKDPKEKFFCSYSQLLQDIRESQTFYPFCKSRSYYDIFKNIILSLLSGKEIILLDSDFSDSEVEKLIGNLSALEKTESVCVSEGLSEQNLIESLKQGASSWKITLFTSGTTGLPKKVSHTFESITRFVRGGEKHQDDIWGFAYNPTHMAGLQVFFQALLNQNPMIRLFGLDKVSIIREIKLNGITNISATPTFYRLLLPPEDICPSVLRITSGGEKFDGHALSLLQGMFPNARITNVYASTEAGTLFAAKGNEFILKEAMKHLVKVENNELFLHKSLMGESSNLKIESDWYATGDLIAVTNLDPFTFCFVSRKNEMINVGGYKVNPIEVEETVRLCAGVLDVSVYAKKNSILGNIVCCEIVRESEDVTELSIREFLRNKLQEFKIPRFMKFVDKLQTTRTGKISRN
ncbi:AMP-binding protein [Bacteroides nordii]|jgi:hypothetical protein|uniref:AMP-binding protein n=1 Tax=Bacteroides nordii TaxID=291645 RepID=UPI0018983E13|nr:AMP-binding protein [Bacteroides nordii]